ncbi:MAG TPA: histidine kinase [Enteractinococcus sp.]
MTIKSTGYRFWYVVLNILAVIVMMFIGSFVTALAIFSAPENFTAAGYDEISNLGAVRFAIGFLILLLIPWYRKLPMVLIVIGAFYAVALQGDPYVLAIGLTVWIVRAEQRWHWVVAGGGLAAILINIGWHAFAVLRWGDRIDTLPAVMTVLIFGFAAVGLVLTIGLMTRQRRRIRHAQETVEAVEHDRSVISSEMTRQTEREHLAREVHDTLAQRLTALSLQAGQMQKSLENTSDPALSNAVQETKQYSDQALKDLRNLVTSLRDHGEKEATVPSVAPDGFHDLKALIDDAARQGLTIHPQIMLNSYDFAPDELQRAVLRITQEALTNVMRHSTDNTVHLRMEGQPGEGLVLQFTNRRAPHQQQFDHGAGTGLLGMKERAGLIGGTAQEEYLPEHFRLTVQLPWANAAA